MNKSDLKSGMKLVTVDGREYIYFKDFYYDNEKDILLGKGASWNSFSGYNDDLTHRTDKFTISKVYEPDHPYTVSEFFGQEFEEFSFKNEWVLVWERYPERTIVLEIKVRDSDEVTDLLEEVMKKLDIAINNRMTE